MRTCTWLAAWIVPSVLPPSTTMISTAVAFWAWWMVCAIALASFNTGIMMEIFTGGECGICNLIVNC